MQLKRLLPVLLAFVLPLLAVYAWWGGFNRVEIAPSVRGPYIYAYVEHTGDYAKLPDRLAEVATALTGAGIRYGNAITILYSNPEVVPRSERKARAGYLLPEVASVPAPLRVETLPQRPVLTARVQATILLAPSRAYQALDAYLQPRGQGIRMPTVEIYEPSNRAMHMGILTVEVPQ